MGDNFFYPGTRLVPENSLHCTPPTHPIPSAFAPMIPDYFREIGATIRCKGLSATMHRKACCAPKGLPKWQSSIRIDRYLSARAITCHAKMAACVHAKMAAPNYGMRPALSKIKPSLQIALDFAKNNTFFGTFKRFTRSFKRFTRSFKRFTHSFKRFTHSFERFTRSFKRFISSFKRFSA